MSNSQASQTGQTQRTMTRRRNRRRRRNLGIRTEPQAGVTGSRTTCTKTGNSSSQFTGCELLQLNLHHCKAATLTLLRNISNAKSPTIALVQEPYVVRGQIVSVPKNVRTFAAPGDETPRAAIFFSANIDMQFDPNRSSKDLAVADLQLEDEATAESRVTCISMYLPGDSMEAAPGEALKKIVADIERQRGLIILGGDVNAHNEFWGSTDTNTRGEDLLAWIASTNLEVLNEGSEPTFVTQTRAEVLDISLCSGSLVDKMLKWRVLPEESFSDHNLIAWHFSFTLKLIPVLFRNIKKINWQVFEDTLATKIAELEATTISDRDGLDLKVDQLTVVLQAALEKACPMVSFTPSQDKYNPWWSTELAELKKLAQKAKNKHSKHHTDETYDAKKEAQQEYRRCLNSAKRTTWVNFCGEVQSLPDTARIIRVLKRIEKRN